MQLSRGLEFRDAALVVLDSSHQYFEAVLSALNRDIDCTEGDCNDVKIELLVLGDTKVEMSVLCVAQLAKDVCLGQGAGS